MRFGLVIDSPCDLPAEFIARHRIINLPVSIQIDGETLLDDRSPELIARFISDNLRERSHNAVSEPYSVEQVSELFLSRLVLEYDCVFCMTTMASRSGIFANAQKASFAILNKYHPIRKGAGITGPFMMRVIDTQTVFAAQGVSVYEALRLIEQDQPMGAIRERLDYIVHNTHGYLIPRDLFYLRARIRSRGDRSVSLVSAGLGTMLDIKPILRAYHGDTGPVGKARGFDQAAEKLFAYATERVLAGLIVPVLCMSYGGDTAEVERLPGYAALRSACADQGVELLLSPMSVSGMVNIGVGGLALGFAAPEHKLPF
jgi:DegV family protein with EDD domain